MPELPEVENVRRSLESLVVGRTIDRVHVRLARLIRTPDDARQFEHLLAGRIIHGVGRRGKHLLLDVRPYTLVSHLRMEGQYSLAESAAEPEQPHTHVLFDLDDGSQLRYRDVRQFGTFDLVAPGQPLPSGLAGLGPEPFDSALTPAAFHALLQRRQAPLKAVLLNQACIAGLGNIYVDEALFAARLHPETPAAAVTRPQATALLQEMQGVLMRAIDAGGSSIRSYVNGYGRHGGFQLQLAVYGRAGEPCVRCQTPLVKTRVAGRGTHLCPSCQRLRHRAAGRKAHG